MTVKTKDIQLKFEESLNEQASVAGKIIYDSLKGYVFTSIRNAITDGATIIRFEYERKSDQFYWMISKVEKNEDFSTKWNFYGDEWATEEDIAQAKAEYGDRWKEALNDEMQLIYTEVGIQIVNSFDGDPRNFANLFTGNNRVMDSKEVTDDIDQEVKKLEAEFGLMIYWEHV